jgi:hypothetical protein
MYSISVRNPDMTTFTQVTSAEIVAQLDQSVAEEARYAASIERIEREGIRYSNQDFDLLSGARAAIWRRLSARCPVHGSLEWHDGRCFTCEEAA